MVPATIFFHGSAGVGLTLDVDSLVKGSPPPYGKIPAEKALDLVPPLR